MKYLKIFKEINESDNNFDFNEVLLECNDMLVDLKDNGYEVEIQNRNIHDNHKYLKYDLRYEYFIRISIIYEDNKDLEIFKEGIKDNILRVKNYLTDLGFKPINIHDYKADCYQVDYVILTQQ